MQNEINYEIYKLQSQVFNFCVRKFYSVNIEVLKDWVQEGLFKAAQKYEKYFNPQKSQLETWVITVTTRHIIDKLRLRKNNLESSNEIPEKGSLDNYEELELSIIKDTLMGTSLYWLVDLLAQGYAESEIREIMNLTEEDYKELVNKLKKTLKL